MGVRDPDWKIGDCLRGSDPARTAYQITAVIEREALVGATSFGYVSVFLATAVDPYTLDADPDAPSIEIARHSPEYRPEHFVKVPRETCDRVVDPALLTPPLYVDDEGMVAVDVKEPVGDDEDDEWAWEFADDNGEVSWLTVSVSHQYAEPLGVGYQDEELSFAHHYEWSAQNSDLSKVAGGTRTLMDQADRPTYSLLTTDIIDDLLESAEHFELHHLRGSATGECAREASCWGDDYGMWFWGNRLGLTLTRQRLNGR